MSEKKQSTVRINDPMLIERYNPFIEPVPPLDIANAQDGEIVIVCLSKRFIPYIAAMIEPLTWIDQFEGSSEEKRHSTGLFQELRNLFINGGGCVLDPCCPETNEKLQVIIDINTEIRDAIETIVTNQTTIIDNSQTIIDNGETVINQNYDQVVQNYYNEFNKFVTENKNQKTINQMIYDGAPESIAPRLSTGGNWNGSGDDAGNGALCTAVKRYIDSVMYTENTYKAQESQIVNGIASAFIAAGLAAAALTGGASVVAGFVVAGTVLAADVAYNAWIATMNDPEVRRKVYCCMYDGLKDTVVSEESFKASVNDCGFDGLSGEANVAYIVNHYNQFTDQYLAFLRMYQDGQAGSASGCLCDCDTDIVLEDFSGTGCTITYIGNCVWKFEQPTVTETTSPPVGRKYFSFRDLLSRCLFVEFADGYPYPSTGGCTTIGCCGNGNYNGDNFGGGFAPTALISVNFWTGGDNSAPQYYKITLVNEEDCD